MTPGMGIGIGLGIGIVFLLFFIGGACPPPNEKNEKNKANAKANAKADTEAWSHLKKKCLRAHRFI